MGINKPKSRGKINERTLGKETGSAGDKNRLVLKKLNTIECHCFGTEKK